MRFNPPSAHESGRLEIYVVPVPDRSGKWQISTAGGDWPRWRRDSRELLYLAPDNTLMAAPITAAGTALQVGEVRPLFPISPRMTFFAGYLGYDYDVPADGQRFLVNTLIEANSAEPPTLLVNWPALLRR